MTNMMPQKKNKGRNYLDIKIKLFEVNIKSHEGKEKRQA